MTRKNIPGKPHFRFGTIYDPKGEPYTPAMKAHNAAAGLLFTIVIVGIVCVIAQLSPAADPCKRLTKQYLNCGTMQDVDYNRERQKLCDYYFDKLNDEGCQ